MKKLFGVLLLTLVCQLTQAQTSPAPAASSTTSSRDDDTLVLTLTASPEETWRKLAQVLNQRGFGINYANQDLLTVSTYLLLVDKAGFMRVSGMVLPNVLVLRFYTSYRGTTAEADQLPRRRHSEDAAWRELEAIAKAVGGSVSYTTSDSNRL